MITPENNAESVSRISLGVSACLLGHSVRFDGGHKRNGFIIEQLGHFFEFTPVCPEVAVGLGTPRSPIRLVGEVAQPRVVGVRDSQLDVTAPLTEFARQCAARMGHLSGYIVKKDSPSCGMERVKVYADNGALNGLGRGIYTRELMRALPLMPVEEEGRLMDPLLRDNFIERVYVYHRWQQLQQAGLTAAGLVDFHSRHKFIFLSRGQKHYRRLGQRIAHVGTSDLPRLAHDYIHDVMEVLKLRATRKRHANVLQHLAGYLKHGLAADDKQELQSVVDDYRRGLVPLVVPMTLLKHHFRRYPDNYVKQQFYMDPHPGELMLRNSV
jgi:uncharacterized protein YbgA (DUF1722 family)/uncharacterized protein YbbK (DUF523 family)